MTQNEQARQLSIFLQKIDAQLAIADAVLTESALVMARSYENMHDEFALRAMAARPEV